MTTTLTATAVALLTACTPAAAPPAPAWTTMQRVQSPPSVWTAATRNGAWLYGDSITVGNSAAAARLVLSRTGRQVAVDANSGIPTAPAVDRLAERVKQRGAPRTLIMATGANDALNPASAKGMAAHIERVRRIVGPKTRIVWVTVLVARPKHAKSDAAGTAAVNAAIRKSGFGVADWHGVLSKAGVAANTRDGVHPVGRGSVLWANLVASCIH